jgi:hypothetical protein
MENKQAEQEKTPELLLSVAKMKSDAGSYLIDKEVIGLMEEYAKVSHQSQLREIREILESRINIIKSEPNGIVRETMIDQLLIELF